MIMTRVLTVVALCALVLSCGPSHPPVTSSGIGQAQADVVVGPSGMTVEQENVKRRVEEDNKPGAVKYLYVLSAYSGEVILQSTVKGKVTSGGKRLEPTSVAATDSQYSGGIPVNVAGYANRRTGEVIQPDGTYGSSVEFVFWWDVQGIYHQHYVSGGQILHVASQPMSFGRVTLDVATSDRDRGPK
jgi:hypothetical protein